jgi:hypothetical protein
MPALSGALTTTEIYFTPIFVATPMVFDGVGVR